MPSVLYRDPDGRFSLWQLASLADPSFSLDDWIFWLRGRAELNDLAEGDDDMRLRTVVNMNRPRARAPSRSWIWTPDLFRLPMQYTMVAEVLDPVTGAQWTFVRTRPVDWGIWLLRFLSLLLVAGLTAAILIQEALRAWVRHRRLRAKEIPYIVGKAVQGNQFIGREDILGTLRDSIALNNFALVGDWRIGKSSIQKRLGELLREVNSEFKFFPVWVDLQLLFGPGGLGEAGFFHYLAQRLIDESSEPLLNEVLKKLDFRKGSPANYSAERLKYDLETVHAFWQQKFAPKKPILVFHIDEVGLLHKFSYDTLLAFRAVFVDSEWVRTVMSGKKLPAVDRPGDLLSPWDNFLNRKIQVGPLTYSAARKLVVEPAKRLFRFEEAAVEQIVAVSESKPMEIQRLCAHVLLYKYQSGHLRRRITKADVDDARDNVKASTASSSATNESGHDIESGVIRETEGAATD
jgi:hypothetical protein